MTRFFQGVFLKIKSEDFTVLALQKTWHASEAALLELEEIAKIIGDSNHSATIRYCIRQVFEALKKRQQETGNTKP